VNPTPGARSTSKVIFRQLQSEKQSYLRWAKAAAEAEQAAELEADDTAVDSAPAPITRARAETAPALAADKVTNPQMKRRKSLEPRRKSIEASRKAEPCHPSWCWRKPSTEEQQFPEQLELHENQKDRAKPAASPKARPSCRKSSLRRPILQQLLHEEIEQRGDLLVSGDHRKAAAETHAEAASELEPIADASESAVLLGAMQRNMAAASKEQARVVRKRSQGRGAQAHRQPKQALKSSMQPPAQSLQSVLRSSRGAWRGRAEEQDLTQRIPPEEIPWAEKPHLDHSSDFMACDDTRLDPELQRRIGPGGAGLPVKQTELESALAKEAFCFAPQGRVTEVIKGRFAPTPEPAAKYPAPQAMAYLLKDLPNAGCQVDDKVISRPAVEVEALKVLSCTWCRAPVPLGKPTNPDGSLSCPNCQRSFDPRYARRVVLGGVLI